MDLTHQPGENRLLFYCSRLGGGGAEKHLVRLINHLAEQNWSIHLALTRDQGSYEKDLSPKIKLHHLSKNINSSTHALLKSFCKLRKLIITIRPSATISIMDNQNALLLSVKMFYSVPNVIIWCQNSPTMSLTNNGVLGKVIKLLLPLLYKKADMVLALSNGVKKELQTTFRVQNNISILNNIGYDDNLSYKLKEPINSPVNDNVFQLVACGRLTKQKGFDILISALATIDQDWCLWILGTGNDETELMALAVEKGIRDRIKFMGFQANPYKFFHRANLFVLSSRWEGFGIVVTEAMASGIAVLSTDCHGPTEIITHMKNGYIVKSNNAKELAQGIKFLIEHEEVRTQLATNGKKRARDFSAENISKSFIRILQSL